MARKTMVALVGVVAALLMTAGAETPASAASPISLLLPQGSAFSVLGHSCGGIQEQAFATGFDPTSGFPTGDVYMQTRCGGSGRGGGYHVTTYSAWVDATWDYTGALVSFGVLTTAPTVDPTFSAFDSFGNEVVNQSNQAHLIWAATFVPPPRVTGVSVTIGPASGGTSLTITGTGLTAATAVDFGDTAAASFTGNGDTSITATSPEASAGTVDLTVTTAGGTSSTSSIDQFTFVAAPVVTGISPDSGPYTGGTMVTITGANLSDATAVTFGEDLVGFFVNDDSSITAYSPGVDGPDTAAVTVTTIGGTSPRTPNARFTFTAVPAPSVTGVSPGSGTINGGTTVLITGANLTNAFEVDFGAIPAEFMVNDDSSISAVSPAASAAGTVDVTVVSAGGTSAASSADQFTYETVTSVQCAALTGNLSTTMTLSRCKPRSTANRKASAPALASILTWTKSGETTIMTLNASSPGQGACRIGSIEYDISGSVDGGTSTYTAVGDTISAQVCINPKGRLSLAKGTKFSL